MVLILVHIYFKKMEAEKANDSAVNSLSSPSATKETVKSKESSQNKTNKKQNTKDDNNHNSNSNSNSNSNDDDDEGDSDKDDYKDDSKKFLHMHITSAELRADDEHWKCVNGVEREYVIKMLQEYVPYFQNKPSFNIMTDTVAGFKKRFLVHPDKEAYAWTLDFDAKSFLELAREGFLTISHEIKLFSDYEPIQILMPWIHMKRSMLDFHDVHVSKSVKKNAKKYTMTTDAAFDEVLLGCIQQHGEGWLYRGERWLLRRIFKAQQLKKMIAERKNIEEEVDPTNSGVHSFELWDGQGQLVAGDLGYTVGGVYTSMTGFRVPDVKGCGTIQMVATAALLRRMGYAWWDLGMVMAYKKELGAVVVTREAFMERLENDRNKIVKFGVAGKVSAGDLVTELREYIKKKQETSKT